MTKHGRITEGKFYDKNDRNTWGYYPEDLKTFEGKRQHILNYLDKNPNKKYDPCQTEPEAQYDIIHPTEFEQVCVSLCIEGKLRASTGLSYKLVKSSSQKKEGLKL